MMCAKVNNLLVLSCSNGGNTHTLYMPKRSEQREQDARLPTHARIFKFKLLHRSDVNPKAGTNANIIAL